MGEALLTPKEAADLLRVPVGTLRHFVRRGDLASVRLPNGETRIEPSDIESFLEACREH